MPRYIEADALKEQCYKFQNEVPRGAMAFVQGQINAAPTVDAVEVVRCKDCIYRVKDDIGRYFCELEDFYVSETDYCSRGERGGADMKILELFAGTRSIGKAFEARGHEVFSVEWDKNFENIDLYADIGTLTAQDILERFGRPDVIWASPDCTTFSIAAISHHRRKNPETGNLDPVSDYAKFCDAVDQHVLALIRELQPALYFIENPRGGLRKMTWMQGLPRYTVTYCQYGDTRMKPTDIWTNHPDPNFRPMCKNGDPCHVSAPRGAKTGTQGLKGSKERSVIPAQLCGHIVAICERYNEEEDAWMR